MIWGNLMNSRRLARTALACFLMAGHFSAPFPNVALSQSLAYSPVRAQRGMVASSDEIASKVGVEILKRGGNAVDAAVAVGLALAVSWPGAGNLGGGGFMIIRTVGGTTTAIDYREAAPAKAHRALYLDKHAGVLPDASTVGHKAVGVPGTVAGLALALEKYGTMKWRDVVEPARALAAEGFTVNYTLAASLRRQDQLLGRFPESRRIFLKGGKHYGDGETFKQPELAETLERLQKDGAREFYEGRTAWLLAEEMKTNGGIVSLDDIKSYKAVERRPLRGNYRGYEIITMPPPSSGGAVLIEMLNILERYDLAAMGHNSSEKYHLLIESMRRAFADRAEFFGDPDFVKVPVERLTSKSYAAELAKSISAHRATPSIRIRRGRPPAGESRHTTHYSVVDAAGNMVSNTYTINGEYGSGVTVGGAGFLLNNEMDDFTAKPGSPNKFGLIQGEANAIEPGKRPLSSMTPTIVLKDGRPFLVVGTEGGPTIITQVLQVLVNIIDHGMNIHQAVNAPRIHHQWLPDVVKHEPYGIAPDVVKALKKRGHKLEIDPDYLYPGDVEGIMIEPGTGVRLGASDLRNPNARAVGY